MAIDILIDKLTPCLEDTSTGAILPTVFSVATTNDIANLDGWLFDWQDADLKRANIYKLLVKGDSTIQGLIACEVVRGAVYVHIAESAPHNKPTNKKYSGVGGHLFAIAMKLSLALGFGGYIYMDAKNTKLVQHYSEMLGAKIAPTRYHEYRLEVLEQDAQKVIEKYTLEGDLNVN